MKKIVILSALVLFVLTSAVALAQENPKSQPMQMYHVVMVKKGPNWKSQNTKEGMDARMDVIHAVQKGAKEGLVITAGLVNDETDVDAIIILNVETKYEAIAILEASPHYKDGMYRADIYSLFAPKGLVMHPQN
jgi:uncharacterized protein YciI